MAVMAAAVISELPGGSLQHQANTPGTRNGERERELSSQFSPNNTMMVCKMSNYRMQYFLSC